MKEKKNNRFVAGNIDWKVKNEEEEEPCFE